LSGCLTQRAHATEADLRRPAYELDSILEFVNCLKGGSVGQCAVTQRPSPEAGDTFAHLFAVDYLGLQEEFSLLLFGEVWFSPGELPVRDDDETCGGQVDRPGQDQ
jgi:hypothetical protein